ncbi:hypothetical protein BASA62_004350 [Batrachochytrium salamandrivorans]|nr:hypothetical protein BASA62_004350 [Batrachochytrium salamandrivorans]
MIALAQVLIATVLIPFAFAAPAVSVNGSDLTTRSGRHLLESKDGRCGAGTRFGCGPRRCCSSSGFCGTTEGHCDLGCQSAFGACESTLPPGVRPPVTKDGRCGAGANSGSVDYMLMPDVDQKDVARTMIYVGLRKSTVTLAVSRHLVSVYPTRISLDIRLAGNS